MEYSIREDGLQIASMHLSTPTVSLVIWVPVGSRSDPSHQSGIAHMVEHLVLSQSIPNTQKSLVTVIENLGGSVQATTEKEHTRFEVRVPSNRWTAALYYLANIFTPLSPQQVEIEATRVTLYNELMQAGPTGPLGILTALEQKLWDNHPLSRSSFGTREGLQNISIEDIVEFHATHYLTLPCLLTAAGPIDHTKLLFALNAFPPAIQPLPGSADHFSTSGPIPHGQQVLWLDESNSAATIALGLAGPGSRDPLVPYLTLLNLVLNVGSRARLQTMLRRVAGIYRIDGQVREYTDLSTLLLWTRVHVAHYKSVTESILSVLEELSTVGATQSELDLARGAYRLHVCAGLESSRLAALWLGNSLLRRGRLLDLKEAMDELDGIELGKFNYNLPALCNPSGLALCIGAPRQTWSALTCLGSFRCRHMWRGPN